MFIAALYISSYAYASSENVHTNDDDFFTANNTVIEHYVSTINSNERIIMINIIAWIIFGALAGWIASIIMKNNAEQGAIGNILTGIAGAFIGGFIVRTLTGSSMDAFSIVGLIVAIAGASLLIAILRAVRGNTSHA